LSEQGSEYLHVLLRRSLRDLERLESARLSRARARLRPAHIGVLAALLDASPLTATELAARCELEPSTMTGLLRSLQEQGLIERQKVVLDQRRQAVSLTPRGRAASRVAVRTRSAVQRVVLRALPRDLARELTTVLGRLSVAVQGAADEEEAKVPASG
jgi:DNA-binding MarR family transcriptional regulator